jgi:hypothetical protein
MPKSFPEKRMFMQSIVQSVLNPSAGRLLFVHFGDPVGENLRSDSKGLVTQLLKTVPLALEKPPFQRMPSLRIP